MNLKCFIFTISVLFLIGINSYAQNTFVPDDNFEQALIDLGYDSGALNDSVPTANINPITSLNVSRKNIGDMTGIEDFTALTVLFCNSNLITHLDLSNNKLLQSIDCQHNSLHELDLSSNTQLRLINCSYNQLTKLNVRNGNNANLNGEAHNNPNLLCIQVDNPEVSYNDFSWYKNAYTSYSEDCSNNKIEMTYIPDDNFEQYLINSGFDYGELNDSVPTIAIMNLKSLNVSNKNIENLTGIEDFVALEKLYCYVNQISEIDLTLNTNLKILQIQGNKLTTLDLSSNVQLMQLICYENDLLDLDLSANYLLTSLNAVNNQLSSLNLRNGNNSNMSTDLRYNPDLLCIEVDNPLDLYNNANWKKNAYTAYSENCSDYAVEMTYVPDDNFEQALINSGLDFDENINDSVPTLALQTVTALYLNSNSIYSFNGIQDCINLKYFYCGNNFIDSLNLSNNLELIELDCSNNNLEELNISANNKLTKLICNDNSLTRIVFAKHDLLEFVNCYNNKIEEITEIESSSLTTLYCNKNKLKKLIVNKLPALVSLVCSNNNLKELDVSSNSQLELLQTERNLLTFINLQNGNNQNLYLYAYENMPSCIQVDDTIIAHNKPNNEWIIDDWSNYSENCTGHHIEMIYIPDDNFEQALLKLRYDDGILNDSVPKAIVQTVQSLNIDDSNISDLTGIENFINLTGIRCNNNKLTRLDLSKNIYLQGIRCENNKIDTLNISSCYGLTDLFCGNNLISEIDVSSFPELYRLLCNENNIVDLDLSKNPDLYYFVANNNNLSSLNLKNRKNLNLQFNVKNNPNLFCIEVDNPVASGTNAYWNKDEQASYSEDCNAYLAKTYIPDDNFEQALIDLGYDSGEPDDSIFTSAIQEITSLDVSDKNISSLQGIEDFINLKSLYCLNNTITQLNLNNNKQLTTVGCRYNQISDLAVDSLTDLKVLDCAENQLNSIDISQNLVLSYFDCSINQLAYIDVTSNLELANLFCPSNKLAKLDVHLNHQLIVLHCGNNQIISLDLSNNTELNTLYCYNNNLSELNLKTGNNWRMTGDGHEMKAHNNPNLTCIQVDDFVASNGYIEWQKDEWANYSEDCSQLAGSIPISEYNALVELYLSTDGNNWSFKTNWLDTTNFEVNDWYGITVENNHVTAIQLQNNFLSGYIPAELKNLKSLSILNLSSNRLGPRFSSGVPVLERCIPDELSEVKSLRYFNVRRNQFMFNDIESVFKWSNFSSIENYIYDQQYPLFVQTELWTEPNESFTISNLNYLPGYSDTYRWEKNNVAIPGANGKDLVIPNPQLSDEGSYICWISNSLATGYEIKTSIIYLKVNDVHGAGVPISEYLALKKFYDSNNGENWFRKENWLDTVTCTVGDWEGIQVKNNHVQWIALDSCNISGALPKELADLKNLEEIHFYENNISGSIPDWINKLSRLSHIYLAKNNLTGAVPSEIGQLPNLKVLELDENQLEGAIPLELKNDTNLNFLSIANNKLTGSIPTELGNLGALWYLNLEHNSLSGTVPASFGDLVELRTLDLSHNQLVGPLPVELKKLNNISRFDIDNNLIGQIDWNKSSLITQNVQTDSNRQIPDEMADLLEMDTLYLGGNKLQFNDIEAIFSWSNFNDFKDFIYFPQDSIGKNKTEIAFTSDSIIFSIQNYFSGPSDKYQWYKNNSAIQGAINSTFKISNLQLSDAGKFYCRVTNPVAKELTLNSKQISLRVTNNFKGAGVPISEFLALAKIYNTNEGENWNNNEYWLDTISYSVNDWDRIIVENGHVASLNLSGLNLSGNAAAFVVDFDSINWLNLSNNKFIFSDLESFATELNSIDEFIYSPQAMIGGKIDTAIYKYESITLEFPNYAQGNNDSYIWNKNGAILENTNKSSYIIENAALSDSGFYTLSISNPLFPDLTLESDTITLKVLIPVKTNDISLSNIRIYPNPASAKIFIDLQNQTADLKVFNIAGTTVFEEKDFATSWLDLKGYLPGIYVFRFEIANSGVINRKVIVE